MSKTIPSEVHYNLSTRSNNEVGELATEVGELALVTLYKQLVKVL